MERKGKMSLIAAVMFVLAVLAVFAGCVVDDQTTAPSGVTVTLWEGNSYALAQDDAESLFQSVPSREGYMFGGWYYDNGTWSLPVTAADLAAAPDGTIVYAKWTASDDLALVTFYDYRDGVVLYRAYVEKGSDLSSFGISPTFRPADERYEYVFKGWDKDLTSIDGDTDVRPVYDEIARTYNVAFIVDNVAVKVVSVPYGGAVDAPEEGDIAQYLPHINGKKVTFSGWSVTADGLSSVTEDIEVYALYSTEDIYFDVTFKYGNGQTTTQTVRYGEDAVPPTYGLDKPDGLGVDYVFVGWNNNYCYVTEDRVINAVYDDHTDWYRVDFYVNGDIYCRYYVEGGEESPMPAEPVKPSDDTNDYEFERWLDSRDREADLSSISSDTEVYAEFAAQKRAYTVEFYVEGRLVGSRSVTTGAAATAPSRGEVQAAISPEEGVDKTFKGWDKTFGDVKSDLVVNAVIERRLDTRTVTFKWGLDGEESAEKTVTFGAAAAAPKIDETKIEKEDAIYVFDGWKVADGGVGSWTSVKSDLVVEAQYKPYPKIFEVRFLDAENALIGDVQMVEYGESAVAPENTPQKAADAQYTYAFTGWDTEFAEVTSDLEIRPVYEKKVRSYTVVFYDADGAQIGEAQTVAYGEGASVPDPAPVKAATPQYEYIFAGWTGGDADRIVGDTEFRPTYTETVRKYNVTFIYGKVGEPDSADYHEVTLQVEYGKSAAAPEIDEAKIEKEDGIYVFDGWEVVTQGYDSWTSVKSDLTVEAQYKKYPKVFEVRFLDAEGALIGDVQMVEYGGLAVAPEQTPQKAANAQYTYAFIGWDTEFAEVTSDLEIRPVYEKKVRSYTVVFYDADGAQIGEAQTVAYGEGASVPDPAPVKAATPQYEYIFAGWTGGDADRIVGDTEFYPTYTETVRKYNVTFIYGKVDDPSSADYRTTTIEVEYGASATAPEEEAAAYRGTDTVEYQFAGWETSNYLNVTGDLTVKAIYRTYEKYFSVTFRDESGALLSAPQYVRFGEDEVVLPDVANIVKQQDVQYTYAFDGWTDDDGAFVPHDKFAAIAAGKVDRDYELTAHFAKTLRKYTVIFYDDDRTTVLSEQQVDYGTSAAEPEAPTKEQTVQWVYEFSGWDSTAWTEVKGDTVVYATYSQALRKYDVTFVYGNVDDPSSGDYRTTTIEVEYGKVPTAPDDLDTSRPSTPKYEYAFNGWNGLLAVSGDMTVTADYIATIRNYKVNFYNMTTGVFEGYNDMPYGSWIERTMSAGGYIFDSWYTKEGDDYTALPTKDDVLAAGGEGHVTGEMTLYGNLVMEGITFDSNNNISGYTGSNSFVVIPTYANRQKVEEINSYMFRGRTQEEIEAVYVPYGVVVNAKAFRSMDDEPYELTNPATWDGIYDEDVVKTIILYVEDSNPGVIITGNFKSNWDSGVPGDNKYFDVKGIETIGDYNYVLLADNTAIIQRFVNGTKKYVEVPTGSVTVGSGENAGEYRITELAGSAFRGMSNVETVFIANEWKDLKVGRYVFSGLTATIYLAIEEPAVGNIPRVETSIGTPWVADWNSGWANTARGDEGEITLEWNCDGLYTQDEVTYLLRSNGEAIAISQEFTFLGGLTKLTVPETLTVNEKTYTVTEIGDQLFKDEMLLTDVSIPGTIKRIGEQAFFGTNLKSLTLAEGLKEIGNLAFAMNSSLAYVYIPASCDTIGYFAFAGANNAELFMGRKSAPTGSGLIGYKVGWNTTVDLTGLDLSSIGSIVTSLVGSGTTLPTYWNAVGKTEVTKEGKNGIALIARAVLEFVVQKDGNARLIRVSQAGVYAKLDNFVIPAEVEYNGVSYTVTSIDGGAFGDWEMETLGIPSTVTSIASNAFSSIKTINTDAAQPTEGTKPVGWEFDATNITINYGQTLG